MRRGAALVAVFAAGCGDERPFDPGRAVQIQFQVSGLPDGGAAEYRVFAADTVPVAHGRVANTETDTVRISSSARLRARWQDALVPVGETDYVFVPGEREILIDESNTDTTVAVGGSFALASGGFILTTPGIPPWPTGFYSIVSEDGGLLANGKLRGSEAVRRGDLPPGPARLELDTALAELGGVQHYFTPTQRVVPLNLSASLDLIPINVPYLVASATVRVILSGLPAGTFAPWAMSSASGEVGFGTLTPAGVPYTVDRLRPGSYTVEWDEVVVDGVRYRPDPPSLTAILEASIEPYEFAAIYAAVP